MTLDEKILEIHMMNTKEHREKFQRSRASEFQP
jgi:hypothetical protein